MRKLGWRFRCVGWMGSTGSRIEGMRRVMGCVEAEWNTSAEEKG